MNVSTAKFGDAVEEKDLDRQFESLEASSHTVVRFDILCRRVLAYLCNCVVDRYGAFNEMSNHKTLRSR